MCQTGMEYISELLNSFLVILTITGCLPANVPFVCVLVTPVRGIRNADLGRIVMFQCAGGGVLVQLRASTVAMAGAAEVEPDS